MTVIIHATSAKNIKLIDKILIAGNYTFSEKKTDSEESIEELARDFRAMVKGRRPQIVGKSLQGL